MPLSEYKAVLMPYNFKTEITNLIIKYSVFRSNYVELEFYEYPNKIFNVSLPVIISLDNYFGKSVDYFYPNFWKDLQVVMLVVDNQLFIKVPIQNLFSKSIDESGNYGAEIFNTSLQKKIGSLHYLE